MKTTRRIAPTGVFGGWLLLATHSPAFAGPSSAESFVPVEHASFHQRVFADEDVAILNNLYPPKGDSGFHTHYRDLFAVIIQASPSSGQGLGKPLTLATRYPAGAALFSPVGPEPRTHRVVNGDEGTLQIIVVELRRPKPLDSAPSTREGVPQYVPISDNARLRSWRLTLEPGQSAPSITQANKGVRVVVRGGLLTTISPGVQDQHLALRAGDFAVQPAGATRALRNAGTETIELVEIELK